MDRQLLLAAGAGAGAAVALQKALGAWLSRAQPSTKPGADSQDKEPSLWDPTPHPSWHPPQSQPPPYASAPADTADADATSADVEFISVEPSTTTSDVMYPLVISSVVPRPIAFVSTLGPDGSGNLAPYSYFNVVSHAPPHVVIGFCANRQREHGKKDSLFNILETK